MDENLWGIGPSYYRSCTDMKWGRAQNFHMCMDSGELKNALRSFTAA